MTNVNGVTMANKQFLKKSEARIIVYLHNASMHVKYVAAISEKLGLDYAYTIRILRGMLAHNWVRREHRENKTFYILKGTAPLNTAKKVLVQNQLRLR